MSAAYNESIDSSEDSHSTHTHAHTPDALENSGRAGWIASLVIGSRRPPKRVKDRGRGGEKRLERGKGWLCPLKARIAASPWRRIEIEARWNAASFHSADPLECFPVESGAKRATLSCLPCPNESATTEQNSSSSRREDGTQ